MAAERDDRLSTLEARIAAARTARRPARGGGADKFNAMALAWRLVTELVVGVLIGAAIGWGIGAMVGATPLFLVVFGLLGFAAGVRVMMRTAEEDRKRRAAQTAESGRAGGGAGARD